MSDWLFERHGLGPRFAKVSTIERDDKILSFAMLDLPHTGFDLISAEDEPQDLGAFDEIALLDEGMLRGLDLAFAGGDRSKKKWTNQQMALALIKARADTLNPNDELAMRRVARWAKNYEWQAWWLCKNRQLAFSMEKINWLALGIGIE